ncbi:DUF58 domain-containing protein [Ferrimicrobium sp.]|uniref:DUF58 domain-containing protein n=1 Tax=Ferrimicrobium sp. TaxID=2926050 RepID=UPI00262F397D|nr:DUF58 domain-containing protein [Ferrimicrobium sp.]
MGIRFRGGVVLLGTLTTLLFAIFTGGLLAWHLCDFLLVLLAVAIFSQLGPLSSVVITRELGPGPYYAGRWLDVTLTVRATKWPWLHLFVVDRLESAQGEMEHRFVLTTVGGRAQTIGYQVTELARGTLEFGNITLITSDFFGLFQRSIDINQEPIKLHVWPSVVGLSRTELKNYLGHGQQFDVHRTRQAFTQLVGVREYVLGDRLSHIHWKTSARTGEFKVKYFEPENRSECIVMLDTSRHFTPFDWELAVSIAASLAYQASRSRLALRIATLDQPTHEVPASSGNVALAKIMDFLSVLPYGNQEPSTSLGGARYAHNMLVITTSAHQATWRGNAESIIVVGTGGFTSLPNWRESLRPIRPRTQVSR